MPRSSKQSLSHVSELTEGLKDFADFLDATLQYYRFVGGLTSKRSMQRFQKLTSRPDALVSATRGLKPADATLLYGSLLRLNALAPQLVQYSNLPKDKQRGAQSELEAISRTFRSLAAHLRG